MTNNSAAESAIAVKKDSKEKGRTYRPGRIRERNRERILIAAEEEFALNGYKGTTIQNIAERAGLPKSNVLYYFSNKKRMYGAMFDDILARWNKVFTEISPEDDPAEAL
ncbi:MAG TPA: TetR/AcrR family transcriptional regulator, partial [Marinobacter adhaerens]|nr:TetR/AcrR family transcriptional regulator [Marinobacter adhaerens]